eukprot:TRINITY_DN5539_c0_g1_i1.p3 TRINITY_DN5539_c0_g1~~TRINITY_DN5539_c0_g1_i1.p3  ORF type:complete len:111 (-),score=3.57 TRINITY_DN5539_c0_g1_i1:251-583(-)
MAPAPARPPSTMLHSVWQQPLATLTPVQQQSNSNTHMDALLRWATPLACTVTLLGAAAHSYTLWEYNRLAHPRKGGAAAAIRHYGSGVMLRCSLLTSYVYFVAALGQSGT